ncbi:MAG: hypothetical protein ACFFBD_16305 [Candidatus Hodarchaeota archaeon]
MRLWDLKYIAGLLLGIFLVMGSTIGIFTANLEFIFFLIGFGLGILLIVGNVYYFKTYRDMLK